MLRSSSKAALFTQHSRNVPARQPAHAEAAISISVPVQLQARSLSIITSSTTSRRERLRQTLTGEPKRFLALLLSLFLATASAAPAYAQKSTPPKASFAATGTDADAKPPVDPKKAKLAYSRGREAEKNADWRAAYEAYSEALREAPDNREYELHRAIARSRLVQEYVDRAERDAVAGRMLQARAELSAAIALDPGDEMARERWRELSPQETIIKDRPDEDSLAGPVYLQPKPGTHTFDLRGTTQQAYQEVAKQFGVKVSFDVDMRSRNVRLRLSDVTFETAMKVLGPMTDTFWRPLAKDLFFVADDNPQKRRDYDTSMVRTVVLPASSTPEDATEILRVVREVTGITRTQLDTRGRTITMRATPQAIALATAVIQDLEQPRGQLVLDVDILEVNRDNARNLGILPPQKTQLFSISKQEIQEAQSGLSGLVAVLEQIFGTPSSLGGLSGSEVGTLIGAGQLGLGSLIPPLLVFGGGKTTFLATLPGASANFSSMMSVVRDGRRVRLRAEDGHPATFFVGDRVPVSYAQFSNSLTSAFNIPGVGAATFPTGSLVTGALPAAVTTGVLRAPVAGTVTQLFEDIIVANNTDNTVSIFLGNGDGTFSAKTDFMVGNGPASVAVGNFNADSNLDIVTANQTDGTVSVLLGNGDGTFAAHQDFPVGKNPVSVAVADVNGDGHADLIVANQDDNTLSILLGNGDGTFQPQTTIGTGLAPTQVIASDFNADGKVDLAVVNQNSNTVSVFLGAGDGTFPTRTDYATGAGPIALAAGDLNGDALIDLAVANKADDTVSVLLGNGDGTFGPQTPFPTSNGPDSVVIADFNEDGRPDLAISEQSSNTVSLLLGLGAGQFAPPFDLPVGTSPSGIAEADFNSDGLPDLVLSNAGSDTATVILNSGAAAAGIANAEAGGIGQPYPGVEYLDLGVKLKVTPRMHPNNEVTLQASLEVRSLTGISLNQLPIISNRTIEQTVRLKENQTSLLAAFLDVDNTKTLNGWPGISNLEGLNYLLGDTNSDDTVDEVLVLITPRRLNPAPRTEHVLYAGHAPSQGAGSSNVGPTFDEQHSPAEAPQPQQQPPPDSENPPTQIVVPLPAQQPPPK